MPDFVCVADGGSCLKYPGWRSATNLPVLLSCSSIFQSACPLALTLRDRSGHWEKYVDSCPKKLTLVSGLKSHNLTYLSQCSSKWCKAAKCCEKLLRQLFLVALLWVTCKLQQQPPRSKCYVILLHVAAVAVALGGCNSSADAPRIGSLGSGRPSSSLCCCWSAVVLLLCNQQITAFNGWMSLPENGKARKGGEIARAGAGAGAGPNQAQTHSARARLPIIFLKHFR